MRFRNQDPIFQECQDTFPPRVTNTRIIKRRVAGVQPFVVRPEGKCEGSEYLKGPVPKHPSLVVMGRCGDGGRRVRWQLFSNRILALPINTCHTGLTTL